MNTLRPNSFIDRQGDDLVFIDPLSRVRLADAWPTILDQDEVCTSGREYLERSSARITYVGSAHGYPEDFEDALREHGRVLRGADVLGLEVNEREAGPGKIGSAERVEVPNGGQGDFVRAQLAWAQENGTPVIPCDIDTPVDGLRKTLYSLFLGDVDTERLGLVDEGITSKEAAILLGQCAYMAMRTIMMTAHAGYQLRRLSLPGKEPRLAFTVGELHVPTIAQQAGDMFSMGDRVTHATVKNYTVPLEDSPELRLRRRLTQLAKETGRLTLSNLQEAQDFYGGARNSADRK